MRAGAYDTLLPWNDAAHDFSTQGYLVEFGGYPIDESTTITNLSSSDIAVEFPTGSPTHQISSSLDASRSVTFDFIQISERDGSSGTLVRSFDVEPIRFLGYLENDTLSFSSPLIGLPSAKQNSSLTFVFVRTVGGVANTTNQTVEQLLDEAFSGDLLKWSLKIRGWPFTQPANVLRVDLNVSASGRPRLALSNSSSTYGEKLLTVQEGNLDVFLAILDTITADGNLTTMPREPQIVGNQLQIFLPFFQMELLLDPTLAVLVNEEDDGTDDTPLILGLTIGLVGGLSVLILVGGLGTVATVILWNWWWRRRGRVGKAINWEGKTDTSDTL